MNNPIIGFQYLLNGFRLIAQPRIRRYVILPVLMNVLLFIGLFMLASHYFHEATAWINYHTPSWLHWIDNILWMIFIISFFLVIIYTFVTFANLFSAPFNSLLAEKVEEFLSGKTPPSRSWRFLLSDGLRSIYRQFSIMLFYIPRAILLLILFFIPVVQIIAAPLWFLFGAWFAALQAFDYPTDNHQIAFRDVRMQLDSNRLGTLGFGSGILLLAAIPVINFLIIPASVAGATQYWFEQHRTLSKSIS